MRFFQSLNLSITQSLNHNWNARPPAQSKIQNPKSKIAFRPCLPLLFLFAASICTRVSAQQGQGDLEFSVSPSPVGSGARAAGMADAFVAIADDATAASWNPAGLVQLERPEVSLVGAYNGLFEEVHADFDPELDGWNSDNNFDLNYLSVAYPLPVLVLGRNATVSLNYQRKYDFSRDLKLNFKLAYITGAGSPVNQQYKVHFEQEGGLSALTPAFAIEITKRLSIGASVNFWRSSFLSENGWEQHMRVEAFTLISGANAMTTDYSLFETNEKYKDFSAENLVLGVLWNLGDRWSLGARYDTAVSGNVDYERTGSILEHQVLGGNFIASMLNSRGVKTGEPREIRFPSAAALGIACRVNDRLTLAGDVTRSDWQDSWYKGRDPQRISLINGRNLKSFWSPPPVQRTISFDPTYTARLGAEYVFLPQQPEEELKRLWTLRGGLFYDQEAATGAPDDFWGLALGVGLLTKQRVNVDLAYQLRYGHDVNSDFIRLGNAYVKRGAGEEVVQNRIVLSTVIYF